MVHVVEGQRGFTVEEYHRMGDAGVLGPDERVELILGVVREMTPKGRRHRAAVGLALQIFDRRLAGKASVQIQDPLTLTGFQSEPEPDVVVASSPDPRDVGTDRSEPLLVIEVADTSLRFDRKTKAHLYAEAGVAEYWILNLVDDVLEIFRDPEGDTYRTRIVVEPNQTVAPLSFPELEIAVSDLIP